MTSLLVSADHPGHDRAKRGRRIVSCNFESCGSSDRRYPNVLNAQELLEFEASS
jgi:hypothetical protein